MQNKSKSTTSVIGGAAAGILGVGSFVHGSSAAALTAKLALIGGGSMAAGITILSLVPLITAGVTLWGYKQYQNKKGGKTL